MGGCKNVLKIPKFKGSFVLIYFILIMYDDGGGNKKVLSLGWGDSTLQLVDVVQFLLRQQS